MAEDRIADCATGVIEIKINPLGQAAARAASISSLF
jgi:hypothetical protein